MSSASLKLKDVSLAMGTGRRKSSVARVYIREGIGNIIVNKKDINEYIQIETLRKVAITPLVVTETLGKYDILVNIYGGGISGQAGAIRHGISRALLALNEDNKIILRTSGLLTRDSRVVERKKYGKKKARKSFQFSKR